MSVNRDLLSASSAHSSEPSRLDTYANDPDLVPTVVELGVTELRADESDKRVMICSPVVTDD